MLPIACLVRLVVDFSHPAQWGPYAFVMMGFPQIFIIAEPSSHWRKGSTVRCVWPVLLQACRDAKGRGSFREAVCSFLVQQEQVTDTRDSCVVTNWVSSSLQPTLLCKERNVYSHYSCPSAWQLLFYWTSRQGLWKVQDWGRSYPGEWVEAESYLPLGWECPYAQIFAEMG